MTDTTQRTPPTLSDKMHDLAQMVDKLPEEKRQKVDAFISGYLTAMEAIISKQSA